MSENGPDETSSLGKSSENGASHIGSESVNTNTNFKIESTYKPDSSFDDNLESPGMSKSDSVDSDKANEQAETSHGLNKYKQTFENVKSSTDNSISLKRTFDCIYQDGSKVVIKDCKIDCSLTEEQVTIKNRKQVLLSSNEIITIFKTGDISNSERGDRILDPDQNETILADCAKSEEVNQSKELKNSEGSICPNNKLIDETKTNNIFCSTPQKKVEVQEQNINKHTDFEGMSPLEQPMSTKRNLKRKNLRLDSIKEEDEDSSDSCSEKKFKIDNDENQIASSVSKPVDDLSSMSQYEAPAKSILKKWQPSYVSRNVSTSFLVLDETAGNEEDDFEIACKSLTEELIKSATNIDALEKESQMDDDKFEEVWRELNEELDGKTSLSLNTMEESVLSESNITVLSVKPMDISDLSRVDSINDVTLTNEKSSSSGLNSTVIVVGKEVTSVKELSIDGKVLQPRENTICEKADKERNVSLISKLKQHSDSDSSEFNENTAPEHANKSSNRFPDKKDEVDEEDVLLEEDKNSKDKPYHFVEYVSEDPQENLDNYNPEWQKLGKLTNDEERYKAVRDRWRSLIPPDPNKDLTYRQWRERNKLGAISQTTVNNNHRLFEETERSQPCTAVFDMKIEGIMEELDNTRKEILNQRNYDFEELAKQQDLEQRRCLLSGGNALQFAFLHRQQLEQCRELKNMHDNNIKEITYNAEQKIKLLKDASDEVLLFQKFYKGVGNDNHDDDILYMTNTQIQELVETEQMLEQYESFYKG